MKPRTRQSTRESSCWVIKFILTVVTTARWYLWILTMMLLQIDNNESVNSYLIINLLIRNVGCVNKFGPAVVASCRSLVDCGLLFRIKVRPDEPITHCPEWIHPFVWYTYRWRKNTHQFSVLTIKINGKIRRFDRASVIIKWS